MRNMESPNRRSPTRGRSRTAPTGRAPSSWRRSGSRSGRRREGSGSPASSACATTSVRRRSSGSKPVERRPMGQRKCGVASGRSTDGGRHQSRRSANQLRFGETADVITGRWRVCACLVGFSAGHRFEHESNVCPGFGEFLGGHKSLICDDGDPRVQKCLSAAEPGRNFGIHGMSRHRRGAATRRRGMICPQRYEADANTRTASASLR